MNKFDWVNDFVINKQGERVIISAPPITKLEELISLIYFLEKQFKEDSFHESIKIIASLYIDCGTPKTLTSEKRHNDLVLWNMICKVLEIISLNVGDFTVEVIADLITKQILSVALPISDTTSPSSDSNSVSFKELESEIIASLVTTKYANNLIEAYELANTIPYDKLKSYILARNYQLNPELEKKEKEKKQMEKFRKSFFNPNNNRIIRSPIKS